MIRAYTSLLKQIASFGFVVTAFESCAFDAFCHNGESQFLEIVKTLHFFESNPTVAPVDMTKPYSASGHSTGARAVLMLAAVVDNADYLASTQFVNISVGERAVLAKIACVVGDHPDPMSDPAQNPDILHYNRSAEGVPTMLVTGTGDLIEPAHAAWQDFTMMETLRSKVYLNGLGWTHMGEQSPMSSHPEGPFIAYFAQFHALGNSTAGELIYGNGSGSLLARSEAGNFTGGVGDRNSGAGKVGFLACQGASSGIPAKFAHYC